MAAMNRGFLLKVVESVGLLLGPPLVALNVFGFTLGRTGYYYKSDQEWGIALGVLLISLAFVVRKWR